MNEQGESSEKIRIGNNVWIGAKATILTSNILCQIFLGSGIDWLYVSGRNDEDSYIIYSITGNGIWNGR